MKNYLTGALDSALKGQSLQSALDQAVTSLTKAIQKNPANKQAYFERAVAYFELGNFDASLDDYINSNIKPKAIPETAIDTLSFSFGLAKGILKGGTQGAVEFIPSLLSSLNGLSQGLWAFAKDPIQVSSDLVDAAQACIQFIKTNTAKESLTKLVPELQELINNWDHLNQEARGDLTGHILGKYGVDLFAGATAAKGIKAYRDLKKANSLLTLEAMSISAHNNNLIRLQAAQKALARKEILKRANLKIQWDKQGKHLSEHRNFVLKDRRSILEHPNPQQLVHDFAGKGIKIGNYEPGVAGYQELVDFKEFIGYNVERETGIKTATSWGKIHYAQDGVHIVPSNPR